MTSVTEVKFENTINRITSVATPRQIERVIPGAKFSAEIIYTVDDKVSSDETEEDMKLLDEGLKLLEYDYIGGHGSRGYGRIRFGGLRAECVTGDGDDIAEAANKIFEETGI